VGILRHGKDAEPELDWSRYFIRLSTNDVKCLFEDDAPTPQQMEMLVMGFGLILQGQNRQLEKFVKVDFVDGVIEFYVQGNVVRGLREGSIVVDMQRVDKDGEPVPPVIAPQDLPD
jgi:hypothetical protein